jgi:hypothetical protein
MSMPGNTSQTRADIIRQFLPTSPYVGHLGIQLTNMQPDVATLTLPFTDSLITIGTTMHGGAIASLIGEGEGHRQGPRYLQARLTRNTRHHTL